MSNPYGSPYASAGSRTDANVSNTMAGWSLGLALVFCLWPLTSLISIGLAIAALVRSRDGVDHGKKLAIAALIVDGLVLLALAGVFATGLAIGIRDVVEGTDESRRDEAGEVVGSGEVDYLRLRTGDCVAQLQRVEELEPGETGTGVVTVVPCDEPHVAEVFDTYELDPEGYSDQQAIDAAAEQGCLPAYETYVGRDYRRSRLQLLYFNPSADQGLVKDSLVVCLVGTQSGEATTGPLKGSRR